MRKNQVIAATITALATLLAAIITVTYLNQSKATVDSPDKNPNGVRTPPSRPAAPASADEKPLDHSVEVISVKNCWEYKPKAISIEGERFESYGVLTSGCDSEEYVTFTVAGWSRFEGYAAIPAKDSHPITLTVKAGKDVVTQYQVTYGNTAQKIEIDLRGHQTLTFEKPERYPEVVVCKPMLYRK